MWQTSWQSRQVSLRQDSRGSDTWQWALIVTSATLPLLVFALDVAQVSDRGDKEPVVVPPHFGDDVSCQIPESSL